MMSSVGAGKTERFFFSPYIAMTDVYAVSVHNREANGYSSSRIRLWLVLERKKRKHKWRQAYW